MTKKTSSPLSRRLPQRGLRRSGSRMTFGSVAIVFIFSSVDILLAIAVLGDEFCARTVPFVREGGHACGGNPAIVKIEKRADGDGVEDGFVSVAEVAKLARILGSDGGEREGDLLHETKHGFFLGAEFGGVGIV